MLSYSTLCNNLIISPLNFSWDKDLLGKEYLGEVSLSREDWFKDGIVSFEDPQNAVSSLRSDCSSSVSKTPLWL
jgi:hypothetical protein